MLNEDAGDADLNAVDAVVVEAEAFGNPLALVVAGADAVGADRAAVAHALEVHLRIAVGLAGGSQQQAGADAAGEAEHVGRADEAGLGGLGRSVLVMHRRGGAGQMRSTSRRIGSVTSWRISSKLG